MKKPSKAWGSDITYIQTKDRFVCLTTIVDLYDRKIIGWSLIYGNKLISKEQMKLEVFEYIEIWYNRKRRHSALNSATIEEFNNQINYKNVA